MSKPTKATATPAEAPAKAKAPPPPKAPTKSKGGPRSPKATPLKVVGGGPPPAAIPPEADLTWARSEGEPVSRSTPTVDQMYRGLRIVEVGLGCLSALISSDELTEESVNGPEQAGFIPDALVNAEDALGPLWTDLKRALLTHLPESAPWPCVRDINEASRTPYLVHREAGNLYMLLHSDDPIAVAERGNYYQLAEVSRLVIIPDPAAA